MEKRLDLEEMPKIDTSSLIDSMEDAVLVIDSEGNILKGNERFAKITGYDLEDLVGKDLTWFVENLVQEDSRRSEVLKKKILKEKHRSTLDIKIKSKRGEERYINVRSSLVEGRGYSLIVVIARDITEEKNRERALEKSRKKYRNILELSPDGIVVHRDGKLRYINPSGAEILGIKNREKYIGRSIMEVVHPDYREKVKERVKKMTEKGKSVPLIEEKFVRMDDHDVIDVEVAAAPIKIDGEPSVQVIFRDISDRKEAEDTLKKREKKVRDLYESAVEFERCKSKEEVFEVALEAAKNILDFRGCSIDILEDEEFKVKGTIGGVQKEGTRYPVEGIAGRTLKEERSFLIRDMDEEEDAKPKRKNYRSAVSVPIRNYGVFQALSEELDFYDEFDLEMAKVLATHIRETLKRIESEREKSLILDTTEELIVYQDVDGTIKWTNRAAAESVEKKQEDLVGKKCYEVWNSKEKRCEECPVEEAKETGERAEGEIKTSDGRYWLIRVTPELDEEGEVENIVEVALDITDRKRAEKKLKKSLEEKKVLLDEINHRVKNNMQVVSSMLKLHAERGEDEIVSKALQDAQDRIKSMALIHEMLYRSEDMAEIDFADYIEELVGILYRDHLNVDRESLDIKMDLEDINLGISQANPVAQVLNELVSNSFEHAFPESHKGQGEIKISASRKENHVIEMIVSDNGVGVPDDVDLKQSDTFGFQLIKMLVEDQLDGEIELEREGGTSFKIRFEKEGVDHA